VLCVTVVSWCGVFCGGVVGEIATSGRAPRNDDCVKKENGYERVIEIARKEIGVREEGGENCGRDVKGYLDCVGIKSPAPWCAAFVSWCFKRAGFPLPGTAWSPALFPEGRMVKDVKPGYVFGIYFPSLRRIGHCGIIIGLQGDLCMTVEGNTSIFGSREGDGVYRRLRHQRTIAKFSDWVR